MTLQVRTFTFQKLALINGLGSIPIVALCVSMAFYLHSPFPLIFILPLFIVLVLFGHILSTKTSQIKVDEESIVIDELTINRRSFSNYFLNEYGIGMIRLELMLENGKIYTIDYKSWGKNERLFIQFYKKLDAIKIENQEHQKKSEYLGMHMEQVKSMLPIIYVLMGVVVLIDLWWVYSKVTNTETPPTYKFLMVNAAFAYFIPYLRKLKKKK
jgi:hypothetical protein